MLNSIAVRPFMGISAGVIVGVVAFVGIVLAAPSMAEVHAASVSVTFDGVLDLPRPAAGVDSLSAQPPGSPEYLGRDVETASTNLITPYSTEISDDGKTITFIARDTDVDSATDFAESAARRFVERQDRLAISASGVETHETGVRAGTGISTSALAMTASIMGVLGMAAMAFADRIKRTAVVLRRTSSN